MHYKLKQLQYKKYVSSLSYLVMHVHKFKFEQRWKFSSINTFTQEHIFKASEKFIFPLRFTTFENIKSDSLLLILYKEMKCRSRMVKILVVGYGNIFQAHWTISNGLVWGIHRGDRLGWYLLTDGLAFGIAYTDWSKIYWASVEANKQRGWQDKCSKVT